MTGSLSGDLFLLVILTLVFVLYFSVPRGGGCSIKPRPRTPKPDARPYPTGRKK